MDITVGKSYFIESEELEVTVLQAEPCKASALSTENDAMEYLVETYPHRDQPVTRKWVFQDEFIETHGTDDDPFIF